MPDRDAHPLLNLSEILMPRDRAIDKELSFIMPRSAVLARRDLVVTTDKRKAEEKLMRNKYEKIETPIREK